MAKSKIVTEVSWRSGVPVTIPAAEAYKEFEAIRKANNGQLEAETVVKAAKAKRNPLHPEFEWVDKLAAHEHRKERARLLLRSIVIVDEKIPDPRRAYVFIVEPAAEEEPPHKYYATMEDAMADPKTRQAVLDRAYAELSSFRQRYKQLKELADVMGAIDKHLRRG